MSWEDIPFILGITDLLNKISLHCGVFKKGVKTSNYIFKYTKVFRLKKPYLTFPLRSLIFLLIRLERTP